MSEDTHPPGNVASSATAPTEIAKAVERLENELAASESDGDQFSRDIQTVCNAAKRSNLGFLFCPRCSRQMNPATCDDAKALEVKIKEVFGFDFLDIVQPQSKTIWGNDELVDAIKGIIQWHENGCKNG